MAVRARIARQGEIVEVVLRHGWDYMRRLLTGGQPDKPELPPPAVLRNILTDLGPVYVKLGQLLSTRPDLMSPAYIEELSTLQSTVPAVPAEEVEGMIRRYLPKPPEQLFEVLNYRAIAAGSIAQTHYAVLKGGRPVALKVQRPGIERLVARDTGLIRDVARLVSVTQFGQRYNVIALAEEFSEAIQAELDFTTEANYTDQLRRSVAQGKWYDPKQIVVPEILWELTNPKLLVMEWLEGQPILTAPIAREDSPAAEVTRGLITTLLFRVFLKQYFLDGLFHADPHPGNIFYLKDGRIALLDCGMMGRMDPRTRSTLTEMVLAIVNSDAQRCTQLTLDLAEPMQPVNLAKLESEYGQLLGRYYGLSLEQINMAQVFGDVINAGTRNHLRWPANVGLFAKSLANLEGAARQFNPKVNLLDEIRPLMPDLFRQQLVGEDPVQALLRTGLELRNLSMNSPRQFSFLLDRLSSEQFRLSIHIQGLDDLRRNINDAQNRRAASTVIGSLIMGAAILSINQQSPQGQLLSNVLFAVATLIGLWLVFSILRTTRWG